jgi:SAM-dependent methyltransferase
VTDFDALAERYDELRPAGRTWRELTELTLAELAGTTRLIDVGCGTGRFAVLAAERLGARVWGIDASPEMLARARGRPGAGRVGWRHARAERLPFRDGWFDAGHMHLALHALDDRPAALAELARVLAPDGRLVIVTFQRDHFERFFLNPYFPSLRSIDLARFPDPDELVRDLEAAGFSGAGQRRVSQTVVAEPGDVVERVRGRYISTLHLVDEAEYAAGLALLEDEAAAGRAAFTYHLEWALITARRGAGSASPGSRPAPG